MTRSTAFSTQHVQLHETVRLRTNKYDPTELSGRRREKWDDLGMFQHRTGK